AKAYRGGRGDFGWVPRFRHHRHKRVRRPDPDGHDRIRHRLRERVGSVSRYLLPAVRERGARC
ncbi:unnamed protein product, partial [Ectocarpus fasciculatus]